MGNLWIATIVECILWANGSAQKTKRPHPLQPPIQPLHPFKLHETLLVHIYIFTLNSISSRPEPESLGHCCNHWSHTFSIFNHILSPLWLLQGTKVPLLAQPQLRI